MLTMVTTVPQSVSDRAAVASNAMDEAAFRAFYQQTAGRLRAFLLRGLGDPQLADDFVQEAYFRLLRSKLKTDDEDHRRAYLFRIATNLMTDHYRKRRPEEPLSRDLPGGLSPQGSVDRRSDVAMALRGLSPRDRQMLWLAYVEGSSHQEIARAFGLRRSSLKSMLSRARHRLAEELRALGLQPVKENRS